MAKIAIVSTLPLTEFAVHLELGGHKILQSKNFFELQNAEIFHFVFDTSLQSKPDLEELSTLAFAKARNRKIAVTMRGPKINFLFWPFLKVADMVTVEHKNHWLALPPWVRGNSLLEVLTLPLSLNLKDQSEMIEKFKPYFIERRSQDFLIINQVSKKTISIPHSISFEQQQLLIENSSGYYQQGERAGQKPALLSWDLLINHLNRMYRSLTA